MGEVTQSNEASSQTAKAKKRSNSLNWIIWWNIDKEELSREVAEYDTIKLFKSSRGASIGCLLFSMAVTIAFVFLGRMDSSALIDAFIMFVLCVFIYMKHRWAMIAAMILWTVEKGFLLVHGPSTSTPFVQIIWWSIYMHAFYMAFRVEQERKKRAI